jgi:plastocyanin
MANVSIIDFSFDPPDIPVPLGENVTWRNDGSMAHTVTGKLFGSDQKHPNGIPPGATFSHTFNQSGKFDYVCRFHSEGGAGMVGSVTVT